jgi:hypothetical protein
LMAAKPTAAIAASAVNRRVMWGLLPVRERAFP